jgi:DNA-binding response OmpR family regulator
VTDVLVATDADWVFDEIDAALGDAETTVHRVSTGFEVRPFVKEHEPDLVVLDLQIGNMGGIATCLDLRLEAGAGRVPEPVVLMLLDRHADVFLARRSEADGWLIKPLDSIRVRRAATTLLGGQTYYEGVDGPAAVDASTESMLAGGDQAKAEPTTSDA